MNKIKFQTKNGNTTVADCPFVAMQYWYAGRKGLLHTPGDIFAPETYSERKDLLKTLLMGITTMYHIESHESFYFRAISHNVDEQQFCLDLLKVLLNLGELLYLEINGVMHRNPKYRSIDDE